MIKSETVDGPPLRSASPEISEKVCVIGAGSSGIPMCRALAVRGIPFDCFERAPAAGGLWRYPADDGRSCAYASLFANTSKTVMEYPSYRMPAAYPHYPHHTLVVRYLDNYVDHFGLREHIRFSTEVTSAVPAADGWHVRLSDGTTSRYRALAVASGGRHGEPVRADLPGSFRGRQLHAYDYDRPTEFAGQRVVVIGLGASAADIASEVSSLAATTYLSVRTGNYIVPKLIGGHPIDRLSPLMKRLSPEARRPALTLLLKFVQGDMTHYGLPAPPFKPGQAPLVATEDLLTAIAHGRITPKPSVVRLDRRSVLFADGSEHEADVIIHCTGYRISFPFLDHSVVAGGDDAPPLYHLVVPPETGGLYFIGLIHSMMALMPVAEAQCEWVADLLSGRVSLPSRDKMWSTIRRHRRRQAKRFYNTSGGLLVEPQEYIRLIERERKIHATDRHLPLDHCSGAA